MKVTGLKRNMMWGDISYTCTFEDDHGRSWVITRGTASGALRAARRWNKKLRKAEK